MTESFPILNITIMALVVWLIPLQMLPLLIWLERKGSAIIQDRPGPNRAEILGIRLFGLFHTIADVIKLFMKEDVIPEHANRFYYLLAPFWTMTISLIPLMLVPLAAPLDLPGLFFRFQVADLQGGILLLLAVTGLAVYGIILAGWSSNNKFSLLGGLRSSAQMISYELTMGLAVVGILMVYPDLRLNGIVEMQGQPLVFLGHTLPLPAWGILTQPLGFFLFATAAYAESNRIPFDLPEGESELVAGFHVEYSSIKFALFFMAEYVNMVVASFIIATLYFGGYQIPWFDTATLRAHPSGTLSAFLVYMGLLAIAFGIILYKRGNRMKPLYRGIRRAEPYLLASFGFGIGILALATAPFSGSIPFNEAGSQILVVLVQMAALTTKVLFFCWLFVQIRWTLPRFRYDQVMHLGWTLLMPLAILNIVLTGTIIFFGGSL